MKDYILYGDSDSCYIDAQESVLDSLENKDNWFGLSEDDQLKVVCAIADRVENYINEKIYSEVQQKLYKSTVHDARIRFEQEKIAKTGLFRNVKKRYALYTILEDGNRKDDISITGMEVVRSDSPLLFKKALKEVLSLILKDYSDDGVMNLVNKYKKIAKESSIDEVAANVTINNMGKYLDRKDKYKKKSPYQLKGVSHYKRLLTLFGLEENYPEIEEGQKAKVVYTKKNAHQVDVITYQRWPKEFDAVLVPDYDKMIETHFIRKVRFLLSVMGKEEILEQNKAKMDLLFG